MATNPLQPGAAPANPDASFTKGGIAAAMARFSDPIEELKQLVDNAEAMARACYSNVHRLESGEFAGAKPAPWVLAETERLNALLGGTVDQLVRARNMIDFVEVEALL